MPQLVIIALTSMKVTEYKGTMQLGSTNASTIVLNPEIDDLENIITRFKVVRGRSRSFPSTSTSTISEEEDINRYTLEQLLHKSPKENHLIKDIDSTRKWFYKSCTECKKKVLPEEEKVACPDHGEIESPRYMYAVNATIADDTASVPVVLFNDVMTSLLGFDCNELIVKDYPSPSILPSPLQFIKGKPKIFQLSIREHDVKDKISFTVNKIFEPKIPTNDIASTSGSSTKPKKRQVKRSNEIQTTSKKKIRD